MKGAQSATKAAVCEMAVNEATVLHAKHGGKTVYFCCNYCRNRW
jgi:YHS domain-containing protein